MTDRGPDRAAGRTDSDAAAEQLVRVGSVRELLDEGRRIVTTVGDHEILTLAVRGDIYAVANICTHGTIWLDIGDVHPDTLEIQCPFHAGRFSLTTGEATKLPCRIPLQTYDVVVRGDEVLVQVPADTDRPTRL
ncbi:Rieske 2Fe-2S domain-containing protein [Streptomyces sp. NPDC005492]|uniref:Rieske 2Fe-2S domain-containing protein n=1 Tax=Streptomyces sp. NPDC005492 TaxID=3156883 RepID=UPI0033A879CD